MRYLRKLWRMFRGHPLTRDRVLSAFLRVLRWRLAISVLGWPMVMPWVGGTRLILEKGRNGAVGNWYLGLMEFQDMGFVLHFLRRGDRFLDIGANIGAFTVLAGSVVRARVRAVEPHPETAALLARNVAVNALTDRVGIEICAVAQDAGTGHLTATLDTGNRLLATSDGADAVAVPLTTIDLLCADGAPVCLKIDIEGAELDALRGASRTLADPNLKALIIELNDRSTAPDSTFTAIDGLLRGAGLAPFGYDPLTRALLPPPDGAERNWIYLRDPDAAAARLAAAPPVTVLGRTL